MATAATPEAQNMEILHEKAASMWSEGPRQGVLCAVRNERSLAGGQDAAGYACVRLFGISE